MLDEGEGQSKVSLKRGKSKLLIKDWDFLFISLTKNTDGL